MRVTILAYGSRGDVQPYLALGLGLTRARHVVRLAAPEMFRVMAQEYAPELEFFSLPGDPAHLMRAAANPSPVLRVLPGPVRTAATVLAYTAPLVSRLIPAARAACQDAGLIILTLLTAVIGHQIALEQGSADLAALVFPVFTPTEVFPNPLFRPLPGWMHQLGQRAYAAEPRYNFLTHREFNRVFWLGNRLAVNLLNRRGPRLLNPLQEWPFGEMEVLPEETWPARPTPVLYGISRHALGCPGDWAARLEKFSDGCERLTGYWFLDAPASWQPDRDLLDFLEAGPPPVAIGLGSLIPRDAHRLVRIAAAALEQTGQRGIFLSGWSGLPDLSLPGRVFFAGEVPYDWLFPRLSAVIHHGGMGTTAAALRAGIPSLAVPFTFDQPFWGRQIHSLGAGPRPIPPRQLSVPRLAEGIQAMLSEPSIRQRAAMIGEDIRAEDGVRNAVQWIESHINEKRQ